MPGKSLSAASRQRHDQDVEAELTPIAVSTLRDRIDGGDGRLMEMNPAAAQRAREGDQRRVGRNGCRRDLVQPGDELMVARAVDQQYLMGCLGAQPSVELPSQGETGIAGTKNADSHGYSTNRITFCQVLAWVPV